MEKNNLNLTEDSQKPLSLKSLVAIIMADIDIFLLKEEDQETDRVNKLFTVNEIREHLTKTMAKSCDVLKKAGFNIDKPLLNAMNYALWEQLKRDYAKKFSIKDLE
jgi:hypothetical protein